MDAADLRIIATLDPRLQPGAFAVARLAEQAGIPWHFTSGYRSSADQARVCAAIAAGQLPPAPCAAPGSSFHQYAGAFDGSGPRDAAEWQAVGLAGEAAGLVWGGRWSTPDPYHFQLPGTLEALITYRRLRGVLVAGSVAALLVA